MHGRISIRLARCSRRRIQLEYDLRFQVSFNGLTNRSQSEIDNYLLRIDSALALASTNDLAIILTLSG